MDDVVFRLDEGHGAVNVCTYCIHFTLEGVLTRRCTAFPIGSHCQFGREITFTASPLKVITASNSNLMRIAGKPNLKQIERGNVDGTFGQFRAIDCSPR